MNSIRHLVKHRPLWQFSTTWATLKQFGEVKQNREFVNFPSDSRSQVFINIYISYFFQVAVLLHAQGAKVL